MEHYLPRHLVPARDGHVAISFIWINRFSRLIQTKLALHNFLP